MLLAVCLVASSSRGHHVVAHAPSNPTRAAHPQQWANAAEQAQYHRSSPRTHASPIAPPPGRLPLSLARGRDMATPVPALVSDVLGADQHQVDLARCPVSADLSRRFSLSASNAMGNVAGPGGTGTATNDATGSTMANGTGPSPRLGEAALTIDARPAAASILRPGTAASIVTLAGSTTTPVPSIAPSHASAAVYDAPPAPTAAPPPPVLPALRPSTLGSGATPIVSPAQSPRVPPPPTPAIGVPTAAAAPTHILGIDLQTFARLVAPKAPCCDSRFELQLGDLIMIGLPVALTGAKLAPRYANVPGIAPYYRRRMRRYAREAQIQLQEQQKRMQEEALEGAPAVAGAHRRGRSRRAAQATTTVERSSSESEAGSDTDVPQGGGTATTDHEDDSDSDESDGDHPYYQDDHDPWQHDSAVGGDTFDPDEYERNGPLGWPSDSDHDDLDDDDLDDDLDASVRPHALDSSSSDDDDLHASFLVPRRRSSTVNSENLPPLGRTGRAGTRTAADGMRLRASAKPRARTRTQSRRRRRDASAHPRHAHRFHISMFHVVFLVQDAGPATRDFVEALYHHVAAPVTRALRHEQVRSEYVRRHAEELLAMRDGATAASRTGSSVGLGMRTPPTSAESAEAMASAAASGMSRTGPATDADEDPYSLVDLMAQLYAVGARGRGAPPVHVVINNHIELTLHIPAHRVPAARHVLALDHLEPEPAGDDDLTDLDYYDDDPNDERNRPWAGSDDENEYVEFEPDPCAAALGIDAADRGAYFPLIRSYHSLALVGDRDAVLRALPSDASPLVRAFVQWIHPNQSFVEAHLHFQVPLYQILRVAAHLIRWGKARIIHPVAFKNMFQVHPDLDLRQLVAPSAASAARMPHAASLPVTDWDARVGGAVFDEDLPGSGAPLRPTTSTATGDVPAPDAPTLAAEFRRMFPTLDLLTVIADLTSKRTLFSAPTPDERNLALQAAALLVARGALLQVHRYVYLKVPEILARVPGLALADFEQLCGAEGAPAVLGAAAGVSGAAGAPRPEERKCVLPVGAGGAGWAAVPKGVREWVKMVGSSNPAYAATFERVALYFTGRFHTDEIAYRTGVERKELNRVLSAYAQELITVMHP
ncbi:Nitrogen permease regulator-like 3 [Allomyces arbusculus]|nr:Nitrogen permease regulator-like 3 [Allomyces arbusculus]